jgi:hypothetical protein
MYTIIRKAGREETSLPTAASLSPCPLPIGRLYAKSQDTEIIWSPEQPGMVYMPVIPVLRRLRQGDLLTFGQVIGRRLAKEAITLVPPHQFPQVGMFLYLRSQFLSTALSLQSFFPSCATAPARHRLG